LHRFDIGVFLASFVLVVVFSIFKSRKEQRGEDSFPASRGLVRPLIGFSLIAANILSEQFVEMNGQAAGHICFLDGHCCYRCNCRPVYYLLVTRSGLLRFFR